jgi:glycosyltransferase involved in cell wall biosynthesis
MCSNKRLNVAFLTRYDRSRASSRVRVYGYLPHFNRWGWECRVLPFPTELSLKARISYLRQALRLARWADVVVLQKLVLREHFVRLLKLINQAIVFDFDDSMYVPPDIAARQDVQDSYRVITKRLSYVIQEARCVIAGSKYLSQYAKQFNNVICTLPSSVDMQHYPAKNIRDTNPVVLGWIGSPENLRDFQPIQDALRTFPKLLNGTAVLKVVSTQPLVIDGVPLSFETWSLDHDIEFLHSFDIGLMPLNDTERSRGRCAFKAIQYMAAGLPVIASPVGAAVEVVEHGTTGFLAATNDQWTDTIVTLVKDSGLRAHLGRAGRAKVDERYSIEANAPRFREILERVAYDET